MPKRDTDSDVHQEHLPPEVPEAPDKAATSSEARTAEQLPDAATDEDRTGGSPDTADDTSPAS